MHKEARYFALKLDLNSTNKERKYKSQEKYKEFKNFLILKINKRGILIRFGGWKKSKN